MKFKIHYDGAYQDELIIEGESIEEIRDLAFAESDKRGWKQEDCWSEQIK